MEKMRLQKYIAMCGIASRRKSESIIEQGRVKVNGTVVSEQGVKVSPEDIISVDGKTIEIEKNKVYVLLNKPRGVVSTVKDNADRKTVLDYLSGIEERLYPVGRLDYNSSGLIILTNDGGFTKFMTHPSHIVGKTYQIETNVMADNEAIVKLRRGIDIGGYITAPAKVVAISEGKKKNIIKITIFEGKNRQIRRMIEALGMKVYALKRIGVGNIYDKNLPTGKWRYLTKKEIRGLGYDID